MARFSISGAASTLSTLYSFFFCLPAHDCVGGVLHDGGGLEVVARRVELKLEELAGVERHGHQGHRRHVAARRGALPGGMKCHIVHVEGSEFPTVKYGDPTD